MKKFLNCITICLIFVFVGTIAGCNRTNNTNVNTTTVNTTTETEETIDLTIDNWEEYLTYQKASTSTSVTTRSLYGYPVYESEGTFVVNFYSKTNASFKNVSISVQLQVFTIAYSNNSSISLSNRVPDDWAFVNKSNVEASIEGYGTYWRIKKNGVLTNKGEISFSEPCKMSYVHSSYGSPRYDTLDDAVSVKVKEISGQVIVPK